MIKARQRLKGVLLGIRWGLAGRLVLLPVLALALLVTVKGLLAFGTPQEEKDQLVAELAAGPRLLGLFGGARSGSARLLCKLKFF